MSPWQSVTVTLLSLMSHLSYVTVTLLSLMSHLSSMTVTLVRTRVSRAIALMSGCCLQRRTWRTCRRWRGRGQAPQAGSTTVSSVTRAHPPFPRDPWGWWSFCNQPAVSQPCTPHSASVPFTFTLTLPLLSPSFSSQSHAPGHHQILLSIFSLALFLLSCGYIVISPLSSYVWFSFFFL